MKGSLVTSLATLIVLAACSCCIGQQVGNCYINETVSCSNAIQWMIDNESEPIRVRCGACNAQNACQQEGQVAIYPSNSNIAWIKKMAQAAGTTNTSGNMTFQLLDEEVICGTKKKCTGCVDDEANGPMCDAINLANNSDYKLKPRRKSGAICYIDDPI